MTATPIKVVPPASSTLCIFLRNCLAATLHTYVSPTCVCELLPTNQHRHSAFLASGFNATSVLFMREIMDSRDVLYGGVGAMRKVNFVFAISGRYQRKLTSNRMWLHGEMMLAPFPAQHFNKLTSSSNKINVALEQDRFLNSDSSDRLLPHLGQVDFWWVRPDAGGPLLSDHWKKPKTVSTSGNTLKAYSKMKSCIV